MKTFSISPAIYKKLAEYTPIVDTMAKNTPFAAPSRESINRYMQKYASASHPDTFTKSKETAAKISKELAKI